MPPPGAKGQVTRDSIRAAAAREFRMHGYQAATLEGIAHQLGITRQAILYHFASKAELLNEVVGSYLSALTEELDDFDRSPPTATQRCRLVERFVDVTIADALAAGILFRDVTSWDQSNIGSRVILCGSRFKAAVAGPDPDLRSETLASCLLGAIIRPLIEPDYRSDDPDSRAAILEAACAITSRIPGCHIEVEAG